MAVCTAFFTPSFFHGLLVLYCYPFAWMGLSFTAAERGMENTVLYPGEQLMFSLNSLVQKWVIESQCFLGMLGFLSFGFSGLFCFWIAPWLESNFWSSSNLDHTTSLAFQISEKLPWFPLIFLLNPLIFLLYGWFRLSYEVPARALGFPLVFWSSIGYTERNYFDSWGAMWGQLEFLRTWLCGLIFEQHIVEAEPVREPPYVPPLKAWICRPVTHVCSVVGCGRAEHLVA